MNDIRYNNRKRCWTLGDHNEDALQDIYEWITREGLYYPYHVDVGYEGHTGLDYTECHEHSFERLLVALRHQWMNGFSIKGYEEYYSEQEREFIEAILESYRK